MFDVKRAYRASLAAHPDDAMVDLPTPWGRALDDACVLQEYPRPTMRRDSYLNLNGLWDFSIEPAPDGRVGVDVLHEGVAAPTGYQGTILVPFSPESLLSGVGRQLKPDELLWYHRTLRAGEIAQLHGERLLLHFQAVDYAMACFVNGSLAGTHEGGYLPFCFDITDLLTDADNELTVCVADPSDTRTQPRGKQKLNRGTVWYTAQSGIWQTVWMEAVPAAHVESLRIEADLDGETLRVAACVSRGGYTLTVRIADDSGTAAQVECAVSDGASQAVISLDVPSPHPWTPDDPFLYRLSIAYGDDRIDSYCAFRTFTVETDARGVKRFCLNHRPLFLRGILDQGYWSDGMLTAPSDEALLFDIETARHLEFNMLRKHIKVESERWYYHCDRLGMIVWQDMVSGGGAYPDFYSSKLPTVVPAIASLQHDTRSYERFGSQDGDYREAWLRHSLQTVDYLRNHPSIAVWGIFNEGWGQFDANRVTEAFRAADPTRPLDQASGWYDQGGGDFSSVHNYFRTLRVPRGIRTRAGIISEFGGLALFIPHHSAIDRAYGYQTCTSTDELQSEVDALLSQADALQEKGLSGFVYTQLSDVEEEVNGLVSYDRCVVKLQPPAHDDE